MAARLPRWRNSLGDSTPPSGRDWAYNRIEAGRVLIEASRQNYVGVSDILLVKPSAARVPADALEFSGSHLGTAL
jgi:hypothetical protein